MTAVEQTGINTKLDVKVSFCKVHVSEILFLLPHQCVFYVQNLLPMRVLCNVTFDVLIHSLMQLVFVLYSFTPKSVNLREVFFW